MAHLKSSKPPIDLSQMLEDKLLSLRICDLSLRIEGTWLQGCVQQLYHELQEKGIPFKPLCYLADEWLTPDKEPVIGIPFYLADPVLTKLEKKMMLEAEGDTKEECMKLLRHETGHAINYAYQLYKKKKWQKIFGRFSSEYPDTYKFRLYSKNFVRHLSDHYAQYHPDEDFTETFAVWLTPGLDWQNHYKGWKALGKLKYVDELMKSIQGKDQIVKNGKKYWQASRLTTTLGHYYKKKRYSHAESFPDFHDVHLRKIFLEKNEENKNLSSAADIIKKYRADILNSVASWTGEKKYIVNDLLKTIQSRCQELKLVSGGNDATVVLKIATYINTLIMNYIYTGWFGGRK